MVEILICIGCLSCSYIFTTYTFIIEIIYFVISSVGVFYIIRITNITIKVSKNEISKSKTETKINNKHNNNKI